MYSTPALRTCPRTVGATRVFPGMIDAYADGVAKGLFNSIASQIKGAAAIYGGHSHQTVTNDAWVNICTCGPLNYNAFSA